VKARYEVNRESRRFGDINYKATTRPVKSILPDLASFLTDQLGKRENMFSMFGSFRDDGSFWDILEV
jgi:hypothetical protein